MMTKSSCGLTFVTFQEEDVLDPLVETEKNKIKKITSPAKESWGSGSVQRAKVSFCEQVELTIK